MQNLPGPVPWGQKEEGSRECREPRGNSWGDQELKGSESGTPGSARNPRLGRNLLAGQPNQTRERSTPHEAIPPWGYGERAPRGTKVMLGKNSAAGRTKTSQRNS